MSVRLPSSTRHLAALALAMCGLVAFVLAIQTAPAGAVPLTGGALPGEALLVPQIVNGQESSISQFPWQVFVLVEEAPGKYGSCGGSILNSTTILTAAHCVTEEGTSTKYSDEQVDLIAGANLVSVQKLLEIEELEEINPAYKATAAEEEEFISPLGPAGTGAQIKAGSISKIASVRVDPNYAAITTSNPIAKDDVAVITLSEPLELTAARNTATISLVGAGATPAAGTSLSISGYGEQSGAEGARPNGKLYSTTLTAMSGSACEEYAGAQSAIYLCAESATSATCQGDSGGPLTEGSPAVQVGIVDSGLAGCPTGKPTLFTNVATPEIRDFIEGNESPPIAPRPSSLPTIKSVGAAPVDFSPLTCEPGTWTGSPTYTYTFQAGSIAGAVLQSGASNVFTPPASLVGAPLICVVQAGNAGGGGTLHSAATAAIAADTGAPTASITALKCHLQACTVSISASDPNAVPLTLTSSVAYEVTAKCPVKKGKKKKKGKQPVCHKTLTVNVPVSVVSPDLYSAAASKLPYGEKITFAALATDTAGLHPVTAPVTSTTLHKPAKPKKKKKKSKKH
ncbi:MAG TPA: serine protease [Solirubrobacteraceae bacterium]